VVLYVHVLGVFTFLLAHGVSAGVAFRLKVERNRDRVAALLDLSASSYKGMAAGFLLLLGSGVALGVMHEWWHSTWFLASLVLLMALAGVMTPMATIRYGKIRRALGLKLPMKGEPQETAAKEPFSDEELDRTLSSVNPWALAGIGFGGIAVILALMMFKPF
jgi:hypothetical protein